MNYIVKKFKDRLIIETDLAEYRFKAKTISIKKQEFSMIDLYRESRHLQREVEYVRMWNTWIEANTREDVRLINNWKLINKVNI